MPEYKHRVTVTKSTSNNQISINIENMGDCIVDVSWNDWEDTCNDSNSQKNNSGNEISSKKKRNIPIWIKKIIDCKIFVLIVKLLSIFLTFFVLILIWGSLISPIKNPILWWFFIITLVILAILSNITVFSINEYKYECIHCLYSFFKFVMIITLVLTNILSYILAKIKIYDDTKTPLIIFTILFLILSFIWLIISSKKYTYESIQIVSQFFLGLITVLGIFIDYFTKNTLTEVIFLYAALLSFYLFIPLFCQVKQCGSLPIKASIHADIKKINATANKQFE